MELTDDLMEALKTATSFEEVANFLQDSNVTLGLSYIAKFTSNPDLNDKAAALLIVQLQAVAAVCAVNAKAYQTIRKTEPNASQKKALYYTLSEEFDKLVMAIKKRI